MVKSRETAKHPRKTSAVIVQLNAQVFVDPVRKDDTTHSSLPRVTECV